MSRPLKKSMHWYTWPEFASSFDGGASILNDLRDSSGGGWSSGGRIEFIIFTDGSAVVRIHLRKGHVRVVREVAVPASVKR